jgi:putative addiction module component (TIGR02574 family)
MSTDELEASVLELPRAERARLAQRLVASLDEGEDEDPAAVEAAWEEEIARRVAELESGAVEAIPAEQVFAEVRARLNR